MIIYGTALLAFCYLLGDWMGNELGHILGVKANVGGVAISMIMLIIGKELLKKRGLLPEKTEFGVLYWAGMYIPIVVAMAAGQNVVAALSGGVVGIVVSILAITATIFAIRIFNKRHNDYDSFEWHSEP